MACGVTDIKKLIEIFCFNINNFKIKLKNNIWL